MNISVATCISCGARVSTPTSPETRCDYCGQPVNPLQLSSESLSSLGIKDLKKRRTRLAQEIDRLVKIRRSNSEQDRFVISKVSKRALLFAALSFVCGVLLGFLTLIIIGLSIGSVVMIWNLYSWSISSGRHMQIQASGPSTESEVALLREKLIALDEVISQRI